MDTKVAVIGIIVETMSVVEKLNSTLHQYADFIIGRLGIPYRPKNLHVISIVIDAPQKVIDELSGKVAAIDGIRVETTCSVI